MRTRSAPLIAAAALAALALSSCRDSPGADSVVAVNPPPVLTVTSPAPNEYLTRGEVDVEASCADDEPCVMEVLMDGEVVATATDRLSTTLPIPDGRQAQLEVRAAGAAPEQAFRWTLAADASRRLRFPAIVSDSPSVRIRDFDGRRYVTRTQVVNLATGARSSVGPGFPVRLTPHGVLTEVCWTFSNPDWHFVTEWRCELYERRPSGSTRLSSEYMGDAGYVPPWNEPWLLVPGAMWNLQTGEPVTVPWDVGWADVAANGDVVSERVDGIYRWRSGELARLTTSGSGPVTDGSLVVFSQKEGALHRIMLRTSAGDVVALTAGGTRTPSRYQHYRVRDGWVAFLVGDAARELWTRSPAGELRRVATLQADATLGEMGPDGAVLVTSGGRVYGVRPGGELVKISTWGYDYNLVMRWVDGVLYVLMRNQIFRTDF